MSTVSPTVASCDEPAARRAWLAWSALALFAASGAQAQGMGGPGGGKGGRPPGAPSEDGGNAKNCASGQAGAPPSLFMVQGYVGERLEKLPGELGLDDKSRPVFARYAACVTRLMDDEVKRSLRPPLPEGDAARAIGQQITDASNRLAAWEDVQQASRALMSQLGWEQQAIANKRLIVSIEPKNWMYKTSM